MLTKPSLLFALSLLIAAPSCRSLEALESRRDQTLADVLATTSGAAVQDSTSKRAQLELQLLDSLQHKYPGRTKTTVITKTERIVTPGQTLYVEVPAKTTPEQAARNQRLVDSLTAKLANQAASYREDLALSGEVANVKKQLLAELNKRGVLPDTTVFFPNAPGYWLRVYHSPAGRYLFTLNTPEKFTDVPTEIHKSEHRPVIYIRNKYWEFPQFWTALGWAVLSTLGAGWLLKTVLNSRPAPQA